MLTDEQRRGFARDGLLRLPGVFEAERAERMRSVVWRELARRHAVDHNDRDTWPRSAVTGMKSSKKSREFDAIMGTALVDALNELFGFEQWAPPKGWGNVLVTFRDAPEWTVPHRVWHSDFPPTLRPDALDVVKVWAVFSRIEAGGGGTPQLAGSHRLFARWLEANPETDYKRAKFGFLKTDPWLHDLSRDVTSPDRVHRFMAETDIDGLPARVVETVGEPGDVWITHPWVFHSIAVNACDEPRMQRSTAIWRRAVSALDSLNP